MKKICQTLLLKKTTSQFYKLLIFSMWEEYIKKKNKQTITFHRNLRSILIESKPSRRRIEKGVKNGLGREILFEIISISDIAMYDATTGSPRTRCIMHLLIMQALRGNGRFVNSFWLFCNIVGCGFLYRNRFTLPSPLIRLIHALISA